ncbi:adenylate kinase [Dermabacter vaginalis]|uniref:Adenylate kinase n=1 Tax=Dermabacter vaginalis TaxID=1630135 RepID=A0ABX6A733_9MICO|nr:adenylate kinase [Dermabacter vaginalis]MCT2149252.1 adenylate kinase [Dermabacter vaginalis]QEU12371.1 adenylate kinase [Dermabacter vaginalis]
MNASTPARRLLIVGPPGAGKGTQAERIVEKLGVPAISTGDIFRANVSNETELGVLAKSYMDKGEYVPDSVTNDMVEGRLGEADAKDGFLLDGYPRTVAQVEALDGILAKLGVELDAVVLLDVDSEAIVQRLLQRGKEQGRSDDNEETIRRRIDVYGEQTTPLIDIYERRGLVKRIDGMKDIDAVTADILAALGA